MPQPSFFIVGAPRCGTTALYRYLEEHPGIFLAPIKEGHFFADDFPDFRRVRTLKSYLAQFAYVPAYVRVAGEASVYYLASKVAIGNIYRFNPQATLIVMLRNPIDMLYSLHALLLSDFNEDVANFEAAWSLQGVRRTGKSIPKTCILPQCLQYEEMGRLGDQVKRLLQVVPRDQVHFILFDDFVRDTERAYVETLAFLGLPSDGRKQFPRVNENRRWQSKTLARTYAVLRRNLTPLREAVRRAIGPDRYSRIAEGTIRALTETQPRPVKSFSFCRELADVFRSDVQLLGDLVGRDLSHWTDKFGFPSRESAVESISSPILYTQYDSSQ